MSTDPLGQALAEAIAATDPTIHERLAHEPDAYLDLVQLTARAAVETDALLRSAVAGARGAGCTWDGIGRALDTTRQAAQQRFGREPEAPVPTATGRTMRLAPLNAFTEMLVLQRAGRFGWHSIAYGANYHVLEKSDVQWQHERVGLLGARRRLLEAQGWETFGSGWFPWTYLKRRTTTPAEPEPTSDDYLMRF